MLPALDLDYVRSQFPALAGDWVFFDNAGGSQTLRGVADRISDYLLTSNVQLGASYDVSQRSGARVRDAHAVIAELIGASRPEEVVMGPSTTALMYTLPLRWPKGSNRATRSSSPTPTTRPISAPG